MTTSTFRCPQCGSSLPAQATLPCPEDSPWSGVRVCRTCGLGTLTPLPTPSEVEALYANEGNWVLHSGSENAEQSLRRATCIESFVPRGTLFEVGVSRGDFLAVMRDRGWVVDGVEPADADRRLAETRFGLTVRGGFFSPDTTPERRYDVLVAWDVLEHCLEPAATLKAMLGFVRPGGYIVLAVPNIEGMGARSFGERWRYRMSPYHLHFFTQAWWQEQSRTLGFELVQTIGFAKVQAWVQAMLPPQAKPWLKRQMAQNAAPSTSSSDSTTRKSGGRNLRTLARKAVFRVNQQPVPVWMADTVEVVLRVRA